jgi:Domain of unknown function (DUF4349)
MSKVRAAAVIMVVGLVGVACSGGGGESLEAGGTSGEDTSMARGAEKAPAVFGATDEGVVQSATRLPSIGAAVIKTGTVTVEVDHDAFTESVQDVVSVAGRYGGFVLSTSLDQKDNRSGTLVIRVPAPNFERALADIKDLGDVEGQSISGQDVSQEFVDLESRLRNLRAQEAVLLELMDRSTTIADTIRVQGELQGVQLSIEEIKGRLNYLDDQTRFGTLSVSLAEAGAVPDRASTLEKAWARSLELALGVASALIVGAGILIPVGLIALVLVLVFRQVKPRFTSTT